MTRRVVVTGIGIASPIGNDLLTATHALQSGQHGIRTMPEWERIDQLQTRLAGVVGDFDLRGIDRKKLRTMGRVSRLATFATRQAIGDAGLTEEQLSSPRTGICHGSTHGSSAAQEEFCRTLFDTASLQDLSPLSYLKFMSHTCAANLAQCFGVRGRVVPSIAACASGSQGIGMGFDIIRDGRQDVMLCGGAEELHYIHATVFDLAYAASTRYSTQPELSPRPFDADRDGLVVAEGAGTLVLEEYEHAKARGAEIHSELIGYGASCDGTHATAPSIDGMARTIQLALDDAQISSNEMDYVNAHGTATDVGDTAESHATARALGNETPISSTKSYTGHTLGACGALEAAFCISAIKNSFLPPNRNLDRVDDNCAPLNYILGDARQAKLRTVMTNNFAFGGINTSLILRQL